MRMTIARRGIAAIAIGAALALPTAVLAATIDGTPNADVLSGTAASDTIHGYGGADTIRGRAGGDWTGTGSTTGGRGGSRP